MKTHHRGAEGAEKEEGNGMEGFAIALALR